MGVCLTAVYLKSSGFKALAVSGLKGLDGVQEATGISWFTHLRDGTVFGFRLCKTQEVMFPLREDHNPPPYSNHCVQRTCTSCRATSFSKVQLSLQVHPKPAQNISETPITKFT